MPNLRNLLFHFKNDYLKRNDPEEYYKRIDDSDKRYQEIKSYADYISVSLLSIGVAHCIKTVTIRKDIPIKLTTDEIAKYADNWNYCFGGDISKSEEDDNYITYKVRINTD